MDVNGTRFHLLLGDDWGRCTDPDGRTLGPLWQGSPSAPPDIAWDAPNSELTLRPEALKLVPGSLDRAPRLEDRRGAGRDAYGNTYQVLADGTGILVTSIGDGTTVPFWPIDERPDQPVQAGGFEPLAPVPGPPQSLRGAAVTEDHYLAVGTLQPPGLLVFDLRTGGPPMHLPWPGEVPFAPFDLAARPGGGVFVLDADNRRAWELDRHFHVVGVAGESSLPSPTGTKGMFEPVGAQPAPPPPPPLSLAAATELGGDPIAIEALAGGGFLVLDRGGDEPSTLIRYQDGAQVGGPVSLEDRAAGIEVAGFDMAIVGHTLLVANQAGKQSCCPTSTRCACSRAGHCSPAGAAPGTTRPGRSSRSCASRAHATSNRRPSSRRCSTAARPAAPGTARCSMRSCRRAARSRSGAQQPTI
jgi:hypothetical protein